MRPSLLLAALLAAAGQEAAAPPPRFVWRETGPGRRDLLLAGRPLLRYRYAYDPATAASREETFKPWHEAFTLAGEPLTKGTGGLYPHHRGLFLGWNRLGHAGRVLDSWHMKGIHQRHLRFLGETAGPERGAARVLVLWEDEAGRPVLEETRTVAVAADPGRGYTLDFTFRLAARWGEVVLDGDPEHAGFHFRAHNGVAEGEPEVKATYTFSRDDADPARDRDLAWALMSFGLHGRRHHVLYLDHPANPKPAVFSAYRDYGRFGSFCRAVIPAGGTLLLRYRLWIAEGGLPPREELARRHRAFAARGAGPAGRT